MINKSLPLLDLHRHLDGNIRPATIWQLAQKHGIELPAASLAEFIPKTIIQDKADSLLAFLEKLEFGISVLASTQDCYQIAYENMQDAQQAGLDYVELRFSPYYMAMSHNLHMHAVVEAVIAGIKDGSRDFQVSANLIGILSRTFGAEMCQRELVSLLANRDAFVAIDLAGDEAGFPAKLFLEHFKKVRDAGLNVTIHAGETDNAQSIWDAIHVLGATRIGHCCSAINDPLLMEHMAKHAIAIESCLNSNYQTGTVKSLAEHPITTFLDNDIAVCLNTDDPAVQNIEIMDEYQIAQNILGFTKSQVTQLQENAVEIAFLSSTEKRNLYEIYL